MFAIITAVPDVEASLAEKIAMETLFDAHHPAIGAVHTPLLYQLESETTLYQFICM